MEAVKTKQPINKENIMKNTIKTLFVGAAVVGMAGIASAVPTLYVSTTGLAGSYTAVANSASGNVTYSGADGVWNLFVTTGFTKPASGSASSPTMDLAISGTSTGAGSLYIGFADTGFGAAAGLIMATISGHVVSGAAETYAFTTFADTLNAQPTTTLPTGVVLTTLSGSLPVNASATALLPGVVPNTLGEIVELSATGATQTSVDASFSPVPDGGMTAMLLGAALSSLALIKRKMMA